jgi:hypothetical protein
MAIRNAPTTTELDRRIQRHRAEMARQRIRPEDSAAALGALLREKIGLEALDATYEEYRQNKFAWLEDEEDSTADGE